MRHGAHCHASAGAPGLTLQIVAALHGCTRGCSDTRRAAHWCRADTLRVVDERSCPERQARIS